MSEKLEACPFCGGEGDMSFYARTSGPEPAGHFVECISCAAAGPGFDIQGDAPDRIEYTKAKAAEAWNTRTSANGEQVERVANPVGLREALEPFLHAAEPILHNDRDCWDPDEWRERWKRVTVGQFRALHAATLPTPKQDARERVKVLEEALERLLRPLSEWQGDEIEIARTTLGNQEERL